MALIRTLRFLLLHSKETGKNSTVFGRLNGLFQKLRNDDFQLLWGFPASTSEHYNSRSAWPISAIYRSSANLKPFHTRATCISFPVALWGCWLMSDSKTGSYTIRKVLVYGKEQESRKKHFITVKKNSSSWEGLTIETRFFRYPEILLEKVVSKWL